MAFQLRDQDGKAVRGASDDSVTYFGFGGEPTGAFQFPWHTNDQFGCCQDRPACLGDLRELSAGHYRFTPDQTPDLGEQVETLKLSIRVHGALASNTPDVIDILSK
ncbi:hypothetical protein [Ferrimonas pelagia]|uniref:Uncharacterized protein n=1 Tax=Ferrimonas pelagia TaxID=1177826 RepID=A0ABP9ESX0_9GAMM